MLRLCGLQDARQISQKTIDAFIVKAIQEGYAPASINSSIRSAQALTGRRFSGALSERPSPPRMTTLTALGKTFAVAQKKRNLKVARALKWLYITGLRIGDLVDIHRDQIQWDQRLLVLAARKTGKVHAIPIHPCIPARGLKDEYPFRASQSYYRKYIRRYAEQAGVPVFTPKMVRTLALTNYELSHAGSGAVLGGHALGKSNVTWRHYLDATQILEKAQRTLALPEEFLDKRTWKHKQLQKKLLADYFDKLRTSDRDAVLRMVSGLSN